MTRFAGCALFAFILSLAAAPAFAAAPDGAAPYQGSSGMTPSAPPSPAAAQQPVAPTAPVMPSAAPAPAVEPPAASLVQPAPGLQAQPAAEAAAPPDPCEGFKSSNANYESCKDRMAKIQRMRDASTQRAEDLKAYYQRLEHRTAPAQPVAPIMPEAAATANQVVPAPEAAAPVVSAPATAP